MNQNPSPNHKQRSDLESLARQWISLWCAPVDWGLFDRLHADNFEDCSSAGRANDKQGFAQGLADFVRVFPDLKAQTDDLVVDLGSNRVAVRWSAAGTNRERYLGTGPTGKLTCITGIEIIEIERDRITRRWGEWDITAHTGHV